MPTEERTNRITPEKQAEYINANGGMCPFCGSGDIEGGPVEIDGCEAWQNVSCHDCEEECQDLFKLQSVTTEFTD